MSALDRTCPCIICGEHTHGLEKCPALREPLKNDVFFKPTGGRPAGGGDDDDEGGGNVNDDEAAKKLKGGEAVTWVPAVDLEDDYLLQTTYNEHRRVLYLL